MGRIDRKEASGDFLWMEREQQTHGMCIYQKQNKAKKMTLAICTHMRPVCASYASFRKNI